MLDRFPKVRFMIQPSVKYLSFEFVNHKIYELGEYITGSVTTIFYSTKNHNALECFSLELYFYSCIQKNFPRMFKIKPWYHDFLCFTSVVLYGWPLNNVVGRDADPRAAKNLRVTYSQPSAHVVPPSSSESMDSNHHGWCSTVVLANYLLIIQNYFGKNLYRSGPAQFKPMLFEQNHTWNVNVCEKVRVRQSYGKNFENSS